MTGTLNQAIQPKVVGPLFKKGGSMFPVQSYLELGLVPLLMWLRGQRPAKRGKAQSRGALAPRPMDELKLDCHIVLLSLVFVDCLID
jgi:hypothetical protein